MARTNVKLTIATTDYDHFRDFRTGVVTADRNVRPGLRIPDQRAHDAVIVELTGEHLRAALPVIAMLVLNGVDDHGLGAGSHRDDGAVDLFLRHGQ